MSEKKVLSVVSDEEGYLIVGIAGREFISTTPVNVVNGKFRAKDILNLVFEEA